MFRALAREQVGKWGRKHMSTLKLLSSKCETLSEENLSRETCCHMNATPSHQHVGIYESQRNAMDLLSLDALTVT